jgi:hypothetical protein
LSKDCLYYGVGVIIDCGGNKTRGTGGVLSENILVARWRVEISVEVMVRRPR